MLLHTGGKEKNELYIEMDGSVSLQKDSVKVGASLNLF